MHTSQSNKIELFQSFIQFGEMMNPELREKLVDMVYRHFFDPNFVYSPALQDCKIPPDLSNWEYVFSKVLQDATFRAIGNNNHELCNQITRDILDWCQKMARKIVREDSFEKEDSQIQEYSQSFSQTSCDEWKDLLKDISVLYTEQKKGWEFYQNKLMTIRDSLKDPALPNKKRQNLSEELTAVKAKILEDWKNCLRIKRMSVERKKINESLSLFIQALNEKYEKIRKLHNLLSPFFRYLGRLWDLSEGAWQRVNWDELERYAKILEQEKGLRELAEFLGRYQTCEQEYEQEIIQKMVIRQEWKPDYATKSEIVGVRFSDDLSNLLPSEAALLSNPETEIIFAKNFVEKKLLTWQYRGQYLVSKEEKVSEVRQKTKEDKRGPIIVCVDTSGSMHGIPEQVAKTIVLALVSVAIRETRKCYCISFSDQIQCLDLSDMEQAVPKLVEFLSMSFHGGTDAMPPLQEAVKKLETDAYCKADVLMVSDFIMSMLPKELSERIQKQKAENKTRFHSLLITHAGNLSLGEANSELLALFNNNWIYDTSDTDSMRGCIRNLHKINVWESNE